MQLKAMVSGQDAMSRMNTDLLNVAPMHRENMGLKQVPARLLQRACTVPGPSCEPAIRSVLAFQWRGEAGNI